MATVKSSAWFTSIKAARCLVAVLLNGTYGRLTLNADGSYSYLVDNFNPRSCTAQ